MTERLIALFAGFPPELATFALAALPFTESRASIPVAVTAFHLTPWEAFFWSVLGNSVPVFALYAILPRAQAWLTCRSSRFCRLYERYAERLRHRNEDSLKRWGALALFTFVALPGIGTGAWGGSLLAVLFKVPSRYGIPAIIAGVVVASLAVTLIVSGVLAGWEFLID